MGLYPQIVLNKDGIADNARKVLQMGIDHAVSITPVVKSLAGHLPVIRSIVDQARSMGIDAVADSNLAFVRKYQNLDVNKWMIREPMLSEIPELVELTDLSLVSERITLERINEYCTAHDEPYSVILMAEIGDLREGSDEEEIIQLAQCVEMMPHVHLAGIGANLSCYGNILPSCTNMGDLIKKAELVQGALGRELEIVSGGNSSSLYMLREGTLPSAVNNLRCGESIMLGRLPCYEEDIEELQQDTAILEAEIVELKNKPSLPWGKSGNGDAFGGIPQFADKGIRRRALVAIGRQSIYLDGLIPVDLGVEILGGASDYIVCDVTDSSEKYDVGSVIQFMCDYAALASAATHDYLFPVRD